MSDDAWRRQGRDEDEDFGPPLFGDVPTTEVKPGDLSFGDADTGLLLHWTEPPTGEVPRVRPTASNPDPSEDLDVWSSFSSQSPVWSDDDASGAIDPSGAVPAAAVPPPPAADPSGGQPWHDDTERDPSQPVRREPGRITIGTDPTDSTGRPMPRRGRQDTPSRGRPGARPAPARPGSRVGAPPAGRDMPTAIAVGVAIAAVFVAALLWRPAAALVIVVIALGLGSVEYFDKVTEKGYRPATIVGIAATIAMPLAVYWVGETAMPLVLVLAFAAASLGFIGAAGVESGPMPNIAITTLGITWIALLGSFAALILRISTFPGAEHIGTDTLFLLALGVVANDVGALFVGSAAGSHPLRAWISPNKSIEGFIGGAVATFVVLGAVGVADKSDTWNSVGDCLWLALVICITAPLGDLTESMFKRNLDIKDFGTLIRGHGGLLDRFDGFLFTLPAVYYLLQVLQPYLTK